MKKIFTLAAILISITSFAAVRPKPAKLTITSKGNEVVMVKIDGVTRTLNRNTFVMDNLAPGNHTISITKTEMMGFRKKTQVLYNSSLYISPSQFVDIDINRNGKVKVSKSTINNNNNKYDRNDRYDNNKNGRDYNGRGYDSKDDHFRH